jgi:hypothetical protein
VKPTPGLEPGTLHYVSAPGAQGRSIWLRLVTLSAVGWARTAEPGTRLGTLANHGTSNGQIHTLIVIALTPSCPWAAAER